jgi:hypothetical protein
VDLIGHGTADHVEVLLRQGDVRFPGRKQLGQGSPGDHQPGDKRNKRFDRQLHFFPLKTWISGNVQDLSAFCTDKGKQNHPSGLDLNQRTSTARVDLLC